MRSSYLLGLMIAAVAARAEDYSNKSEAELARELANPQYTAESNFSPFEAMPFDRCMA